ncbi:MAG: hypothetical protein ABEJ22_05635 [Haloferacaceae archaeon]
MQEFPSVPHVADAPPELLASGHLWIQECVDGLGLRFSLAESGLVVFGDGEATYRTESMPLPYRHAVRHVRERLDRDGLRDAVDDVEAVTFFGVATTHRTVDYDWDRTPSFLGVDVWSGERLLPPDAVEKIFERLGLEPVNAFEREVRAVDFRPESYEVPPSAWYDGPAAGVLLRSKTGGRAVLSRESTGDVEPFDGTAADVAGRVVTGDRVAAAVAALEALDRPADPEEVTARVVEAVVREHHGRLAADATGFDLDAFRSAVATAVQRRRNER